MTRKLRLASTALLVVVLAVLALQIGTAKRADAAPLRTAAVSSRSAGLLESRGAVRLGTVGKPSTKSMQALAALLGRPGLPSPGYDETRATAADWCETQTNNSGVQNWSINVGPVSWDLGQGLSTLLKGVCTGVTGLIIWLVKDVGGTIIKTLVEWMRPAMAWMMTESLGVATGVPLKDCFEEKPVTTTPGTPAPASSTQWVMKPNAKDLPQCNGTGARQKVDFVATRPTFYTILFVSLLMAFPLLLAAIFSAMIKQSLGELGKTLLRLPFVWLIAFVSIFIVSVAVQFRDGLVTFIIGNTNLLGNIDKWMMLGNPDKAGVMMSVAQLLTALAAMIGALMLFVVFTIGNIVIWATVLFLPLATVGLLWGGTTKWFKRVGEFSFAFIFGKVIVVGLLAMAMDLMVAKSP